MTDFLTLFEAGIPSWLEASNPKRMTSYSMPCLFNLAPEINNQSNHFWHLLSHNPMANLRNHSHIFHSNLM